MKLGYSDKHPPKQYTLYGLPWYLRTPLNATTCYSLLQHHLGGLQAVVAAWADKNIVCKAMFHVTGPVGITPTISIRDQRGKLFQNLLPTVFNFRIRSSDNMYKQDSGQGFCKNDIPYTTSLCIRANAMQPFALPQIIAAQAE